VRLGCQLGRWWIEFAVTDAGRGFDAAVDRAGSGRKNMADRLAGMLTRRLRRGINLRINPRADAAPPKARKD